MFDLKTRMQEQRLSARELARILGIPATTVEAWVYEGAVPKALNLDTINNFIAAVCAHHRVIESSNWPLIVFFSCVNRNPEVRVSISLNRQSN